MRELVNVAKALSDPTRVRALLALRGGELCLCHFIALLKLSPSTVSKHLDVLHRAGLVERRKEGRWCHFRLAGRDGRAVAREALRWMQEAAGECREAQADAERVQYLRGRDLKKLACCYKVS